MNISSLKSLYFLEASCLESQSLAIGFFVLFWYLGSNSGTCYHSTTYRVFVFFYFDTKPHYLAEADLKLVTFLPPPPESLGLLGASPLLVATESCVKASMGLGLQASPFPPNLHLRKMGFCFILKFVKKFHPSANLSPSCHHFHKFPPMLLKGGQNVRWTFSPPFLSALASSRGRKHVFWLLPTILWSSFFFGFSALSGPSS